MARKKDGSSVVRLEVKLPEREENEGTYNTWPPLESERWADRILVVNIVVKEAALVNDDTIGIGNALFNAERDLSEVIEAYKSFCEKKRRKCLAREKKAERRKEQAAT